VCFNGILLPNAGLPGFSEDFGAKTWKFTCTTQDYSQVEALLRYASPMQTGNSITGKKYVISAFRSGVLGLKNLTTRAMDKYYNCYIQSPISPDILGDNYWFDIVVIQSAYAEES